MDIGLSSLYVHYILLLCRAVFQHLLVWFLLFHKLCVLIIIFLFNNLLSDVYVIKMIVYIFIITCIL